MKLIILTVLFSISLISFSPAFAGSVLEGKIIVTHESDICRDFTTYEIIVSGQIRLGANSESGGGMNGETVSMDGTTVNGGIIPTGNIDDFFFTGEFISFTASTDCVSISIEDPRTCGEGVEGIKDICEPEPNQGGGGCGGDCTPPTLGVNEMGLRQVTNGFGINGNSINSELYYSHYPLYTAKIGDTITTELIIYENSGTDALSHVELVYGLGKGQSINDRLASIIWDRTFNGIITVTENDPNGLIGNVFVTNSVVPCMPNSETKCTKLIFENFFVNTLNDNNFIVGVNMWDYNRNAWQNYYNDGLEITGYNYNYDPPLVIKKDNSCELTSLGYERYCNEFKMQMIGQALIAKQFFDSSFIQNESEPNHYKITLQDGIYLDDKIN